MDKLIGISIYQAYIKLKVIYKLANIKRYPL